MASTSQAAGKDPVQPSRSAVESTAGSSVNALPSRAMTVSTVSRASNAFKSGVVYGGTALWSAVNGITPHLAGAVDIMVVEQPDGSLKSSPFYVRFGKYTPLRNKDRVVKLHVNGNVADFTMHLGTYGHAYFAAETTELISEDEDEAILAGMMSPPSGYSSGDEAAPYANAEILSAVQDEVQRLKSEQAGSTNIQAALDKHQSTVLHSPLAKLLPPALVPASSAALLQADLEPSVHVREEAGGASSTSMCQDSAPLPSSTLSPKASGGLGPKWPDAMSEQQGNSSGHAAGAQVQADSDVAANMPPSTLGRDGWPPATLPAPSGQYRSASFQSAVGYYQGEAGSETGAGDDEPGGNMTSPFGELQRWATAQQEMPLEELQAAVAFNGSSVDCSDEQQMVAVPALDAAAAAIIEAAVALSADAATTSSSCNHVAETNTGGSADKSGFRGNRKHRRAPSHIVFGFPDNVGGTDPAAAKVAVAGLVPANPLASTSSSEPSRITPVAKSAKATATRWPPRAQHDDPLSACLQGLEASGTPQSHSQHPSPPRRSAKSAPVATCLPGAAAPTSCGSPIVSLLSSSLRALPGMDALEASAARSLLAVTADTAGCPAPGVSALPGGMVGWDTAAGPESGANGNQQLLELQAGVGTPASGEGDRAHNAAVQCAAGLAVVLGASQQAGSSKTKPHLPRNVAAGPTAQHVALGQSGRGVQTEQQPALPPAQPLPLSPPPLAVDPLAHAAAGSPECAKAAGSNLAAAAPAERQQPLQASGGCGSPGGPTAAARQWAARGSSLPPQAADGSSTSRPVPSVHPSPLNMAADRRTLEEEEALLGMSPMSPCVPLGSGLPDGYDAELEEPVEGCNAHLQAGGTSQRSITESVGSTAATAATTAAAATATAAPPALHALELSMCGGALRKIRNCSYGEAQQLFELHRVTAQMFQLRGAELSVSPDLVCCLGGVIYPWSAVAPMMLGMLAYGVKWDGLMNPDTLCWAPGVGASVAEQLSEDTPKKSAAASGSWRLWPFGSWRATGGPKPGISGSPPSSSATTLPAGHALGSGAANGTASNKVQLHEPGAQSPSASAPVPGAVQNGLLQQRKKRAVITKKTLVPTAQQLASLKLKPGQNTIYFRIGTATELRAFIYYYKAGAKLVISDIDGTITRSDVLGHLLPAIGMDWSHAGITKLFKNITDNGYQIMYLSSRSVGQANITREYIRTLVQGGQRMPLGPIIISPHGLLPSLYREMILRRPHEFKIATLQDIRDLFPADINPFHAGFGNRDTDEISYRAVGVPLNRIFIINPKGELRKATSAVHSSSWSSLSAINTLVNDIFPPLAAADSNIAGPADDAFNDLQYWGQDSLMEIDVDALERATTAPRTQLTAMSAPIKPAAAGVVKSAVTAPAALPSVMAAVPAVLQTGSLSAAADVPQQIGLEDALQDDEGSDASDFISTYNPYVG